MDGGRRWAQGTWADTGELFYGGPGLAEAPPGSPYAGRIFAGSGFSSPGYRSIGDFGYSTDRAATWHIPAVRTNMEIAEIVALRSGRVVTAGYLGAALSDDGGDTFRVIPDLYAPSSVRYYDHQALELLPGFTPRAADGGSTEGRLVVVGIDTGDGQAGFVVYVSDDEGDSWRRPARIPMTTELLGGLAAIPEAVGGEPGWAVLALADGLLWATLDGGETWSEVGVVPQMGFYPTASGPWNSTYALSVGPDGRLYAGVVRAGPESWWSWRTTGRVADLLRQAVSEEGAVPRPLGLGLQVYPNPSGDRATVAVSLASPEAVRVVVADALGREVRVVHDGLLTDGQRLAVDLGGLAPGAYVVTATTASGARASAGLTVAR